MFKDTKTAKDRLKGISMKGRTMRPLHEKYPEKLHTNRKEGDPDIAAGLSRKEKGYVNKYGDEAKKSLSLRKAIKSKMQ